MMSSCMILCCITSVYVISVPRVCGGGGGGGEGGSYIGVARASSISSASAARPLSLSTRSRPPHERSSTPEPWTQRQIRLLYNIIIWRKIITIRYSLACAIIYD